MSNRQDLFLLLSQREGQWVSRDDINFVGGSDASRRMRELEEDVMKTMEFKLERRTDSKRRIEYRLVKYIVPTDPATNQRWRWRCASCGSHPSDMTQCQPSVDPRWRLGPCPCTKSGRATFRSVAA